MINPVMTICLSVVLSVNMVAQTMIHSAENIVSEDVPLSQGVYVVEENGASIDYSTAEAGYVSVLFDQDTDSPLRARVNGPEGNYTCTIEPHQWAQLPLSCGNGSYDVAVLSQKEGNTYIKQVSHQFEVTVDEKEITFLISNPYVNYEEAPVAVATAAELVADKSSDSEKIEAVYQYVHTHMEYDHDKAKTVQAGYLPNLDECLAAQKGICYDYASLMAGMLRSQGVPCKIVKGYVQETTEFHCWVSAYNSDIGAWVTLDPTSGRNLTITSIKSEQ